MILASGDGYKKVFPSFKNYKNLKAHLVRSQLPHSDEVVRSKPCGGKIPPCHLPETRKYICTFNSKHLDGIYKISLWQVTTSLRSKSL